MLSKLINQRVIRVIAKGLDGTAERHKVISNNIANAETPKFKRVLVSFENELKMSLGQNKNLKGAVTNTKHIPINFTPLDDVRPKMFNTKEQSLKNDGNNVDVNVEMANMATNSIKFNALSNLITRKIVMMKMAMRSRM